MAEVSTVRQAPAEFIEAAGKNYLEDLTSAVGGIKGLDVSKLYGSTICCRP
jgi:GTP:adenosylcobinamide-phosphate guanylyltransferase